LLEIFPRKYFIPDSSITSVASCEISKGSFSKYKSKVQVE
jgi:hypothetical protein